MPRVFSNRRIRNFGLLSVCTAMIFTSASSARAEVFSSKALSNSSPDASTATGQPAENLVNLGVGWINRSFEAEKTPIQRLNSRLVGSPSLITPAEAIAEQTLSIEASQLAFVETSLDEFGIDQGDRRAFEIVATVVAVLPEPSPVLLSSVFGMMVWGGRILRRIRGGR